MDEPKAQEVKKTQVQSIQQLVKEELNGAIGGIAAVNERVKTIIVGNLVQEEVSRRVKATTAIFQKIIAQERELKKIKPKFLGYDSSGKGIGEPTFTKDEADSLKKGNEQLTKLNGALEMALEKNDFTKVFELAGGE